MGNVYYVLYNILRDLHKVLVLRENRKNIC